MNNDQIIKYIKDNYPTQKDVYFWSTFILPDGTFVLPENDDEEYVDDIYEHANIIGGVADNCFDGVWYDAEQWLEQNCVKGNANYPYLHFPKNPTNKQYWAAEDYMDQLNRPSNCNFDIRHAYDEEDVFNMKTPIYISLYDKDGKAYDLGIYKPSEIIDLVKRGRVSGMLGESKNRKAFRLLIEDLDSMLPYYKNLQSQDKTYLLSFLSKDPTWNEKKEAGQYSKWILDKLNRQIISDSDLGHLNDLLSRFEDSKKQLKDKDINKFKTLVDLEDYLNNEENYTELSHRQEVRQRQKDRHSVDLNNEADLIYENNEWEIWIPKTYAASCKLGQGTKWCTATTESDYYYKQYTNGNKKLYIFINKQNRNEKYQLSVTNMDFMDARDRSVSYRGFMFKNPDVYNFLTSYSKSRNIIISNFEEHLSKVKEFGAKGWIYEYTGQQIDPAIQELIEKIIIPDGVEKIRAWAFQGCSNLKSIEIPNSVTSISNYAFSGCSSLISVIILGSVISIGAGAFYGCHSLTNITIPNSVTSIGNSAFSYCDSLTSIVIPSSVTEIGNEVFLDCGRLTIYCEATSKPSGWSNKWNPDNRPVVWNYKNKQNENLKDKSKSMKNIVEAGGATKPIHKWVNKRQNGIVHEFRGFNIFELPSGKFEIYDGKINEDNLIEDDLRSFENATLYINLLSGMAYIKNRTDLENKDFIILNMSTGIDEKLRDLVELDLSIESTKSKKFGHSYFIKIYGTKDELEAIINKLNLKSFIYLKSWDTKQKSVKVGSGAHSSDYSYGDLLKMGHASRRQDAINYYDNIVSEGLDEDMELNQVPDRKPDNQSRITFGDGNRERILAYLGLDSFSDLDELEDAVARAFEVEDEYLHQLKRGDFGYALAADFESIPHIIEDPADYKDLEEIESFGGITVYRKIKK